jgi:ADP-heptose:LPS heptosyltransferase
LDRERIVKRNVLIFHLGALGDFVLTWPVALALGRLYPQSRVFYVTHGGKGQLAEKALRIDSADIEGGWHALFAENAALPPAALKLLESSHTVVTFLSDGNDIWSRNVQRIAPDVDLVALIPPTLNAPPVGEHASAFIEKQLAPWPALATAVQQILRSIADRGIGGRAAGEGGVVIHPGSGAVFKCWPIERFIELARRLVAEGRRVKFVLGEVERERWPAAAVAELAATAPVEQPQGPVELWKLISGASLYIGNDSGPAHLAGMAGVPTVVIFGPTSPEVWKPLGPRVVAVQGDSLEAVTVSDVAASAGLNQ